MSILHFEYVPYLGVTAFGSDLEDYDALFPTGNAQLDKLIRDALALDHTNIKGITDRTSDFKPIRYFYDEANNLIHVWVQSKDNSPVTPQELAEFLYDYSPDDRGPDTWMMRDIEIVPKEIANFFGLGMIEMVPKLIRIWVVDNNQEYLVDTSKLPKGGY